MRKSYLLYVLIGLSGFSGLTYEIVWTRQLTLLFGVSIYAVSAVIAVFLLGLAAGSYFFGRLADQRGSPLVFFGMIELSVGLYAVLFPLVMKAIEPVYLALYDYNLSRLTIFFLRFVLTFVLLIVPTVFMGGTLPVMGKLFSGSFDRFGNAVAKLYGLNTLGGMLGATLSGFFLLRWLGVSGATRVALSCNLLVGVASLVLWRYREAQPDGPESRTRLSRDKKKKAHRDRFPFTLRRRVQVVVLLSGFCALSYEVLWTKMLTLILGNSSWAFSTVLVARQP
ncbi:MAG: fused MFS/spermidine synthase, partial [bacterium]